MLITTAIFDSPNKLVRARFLFKTQVPLFVVAGHLNDVQFFTDVFDKKEVLHAISGDEIAIFLFADEQGGLLEIKTGEGQRGYCLGANSTYPSHHSTMIDIFGGCTNIFRKFEFLTCINTTSVMK